MASDIDAGLYSVPNGLTHTSNPKSLSCFPILSEKQLPSIIILSLYDMPTLHFSSATGVCSFIEAKLSKNHNTFLSLKDFSMRSFTSFRMTEEIVILNRKKNL